MDRAMKAGLKDWQRQGLPMTYQLHWIREPEVEERWKRGELDAGQPVKFYRHSDRIPPSFTIDASELGPEFAGKGECKVVPVRISPDSTIGTAPEGVPQGAGMPRAVSTPSAAPPKIEPVAPAPAPAAPSPPPPPAGAGDVLDASEVQE
mmetsp:Transcript_28267/g.64025  ORF Transcript_28267/g.64025 Transcript_28267/m.64025 type:complete len:149 (-) Transcript_28267:123-569(-)